jgi:hypothetical protein
VTAASEQAAEKQKNDALNAYRAAKAVYEEVAGRLTKAELLNAA